MLECNTFFLFWSFHHFIMSFIIFMAFVLECVLSDMNIATLSLLSFPFIWNIAFHPLTSNLCVSFTLKWVSCRQHIVGFCFIIQSAILCPLIGAYSPLTFKVSTDRYVLIGILMLVFQLILYFFFIPFFFFLFFLLWFDGFLYYGCVLSFCFLWIFCEFVVTYFNPLLYLLALSHIGSETF